MTNVGRIREKGIRENLCFTRFSTILPTFPKCIITQLRHKTSQVARQALSFKNLQTLHGYILIILQHFNVTVVFSGDFTPRGTRCVDAQWQL